MNWRINDNYQLHNSNNTIKFHNTTRLPNMVAWRSRRARKH
jgi:hypothetical protein